MTLLNHFLVSKGYQAKAGVGNINPSLYQLARSTPIAFHDITAGNNVANTNAGAFGYQAGPGYDQVTELGSVDAYNLVTHWHGQPSATVTATTLTMLSTAASIASSGSVSITAVVGGGNVLLPPAGTVTLSLGSTKLASAKAVPWGASAMADVPRVQGSSLAAGSNTLTASFTGAENFGNSSASIGIIVTQPTTLNAVASPASISKTGSSEVTVTVQPPGGSATPFGDRHSGERVGDPGHGVCDSSGYGGECGVRAAWKPTADGDQCCQSNVSRECGDVADLVSDDGDGPLSATRGRAPAGGSAPPG